MQKVFLFALTMMLLTGLSLSTNADPGQRQKGAGKKPQDRGQMFQRLDKNNDQSLSKEEFINRPKRGNGQGQGQDRIEKIFSRIDKNGDGSISKQEFVAAQPRKGNRQGGQGNKQGGQGKKPGQGKKQTETQI